MIPVAFRRALGLEEGDRVVAVLDEDSVRFMTPAQALERARRVLRQHVPADRDLVRELIDERRDEAARE